MRRDLLSGVRQFAVRAVDDLRHYGWLDEILKEEKGNLFGVQLSGANLRQVDLTEANLYQANLEEARRSVLDLRAAPLEDRSLVEALEHLVQDKPGLPDVEVTLVIIGGGRPLPLRIEVGIYRIVQEALSNVSKHAGASKVKVILETTPDQVRLEVEDDGRGFDPGKVTGDRYGLVGLNERAKLLAGQMHLESGEGKGTRLEIIVPLLD